MIKTVEEYYNEVMERGTPEAKGLLQMEVLFAGTMSRKVAAHLGATEKFREELHNELIALLISHRGPVVANYLLERASGEPMPVDGPVVVAQKPD